jgi:cation diffusion facilitator CzcD-associated flavoprotein CzcO
MTREPRIVIIGAGLAGIATAVTFQRNGFHDFSILEKGADVGGVWHWNRYPGLTCDVPSQLYQFSFAPKPDWTGMFAPGDEIQRYLRDVVERFGLDDRLQLNAEAVSTVFTGSRWQITTADGGELEADFVIAATGVLHHPLRRTSLGSTHSAAMSCTPRGGTTTSRPAAAESPSSGTVRPGADRVRPAA